MKKKMVILCGIICMVCTVGNAEDFPKVVNAAENISFEAQETKEEKEITDESSLELEEMPVAGNEIQESAEEEFQTEDMEITKQEPESTEK